MGLLEADTKVDYEKDEDARVEALRLFTLCTLPLAVRAAILLNVPEILLEAGPGKSLSAEEISKLVPVPAGAPAADATNLERILRILANHDVVKESTAKKPGELGTIERRYGASAVLKYLRDDDGSIGPLIGMLPFLLPQFENVHKIVLDKSNDAFLLTNGKSLVEFLSKNPEFSGKFQSSMTSHNGLFLPMLLDQYDGFKNAKIVVDVGGGPGQTLAAIVSKYPHIRGINFELPHVTSVAPQWPGVEHVAGCFFNDAIPDCDTAYMRWILHLFDDEKCVKILKAIGKAMPEHGKIINVEAILPEGLDPAPISAINFGYDMLMMAMTNGGKERTLADYRRLGAEAGFSRVEVIVNIDNLAITEFHRK